ncbi:MAG: NnrS family protein [Alphaproteobacteria bacterium]|nr:NnrS family protein [Alphaproteobacteria bacterium]
MNSDPDRQVPFLSYGFRPFFLFAGLYAVLAIAAWTGWLALHDMPGVWITPTFAGPPQQWHAHEMIFGFGMAVVSGFMLTAVPSWTGARRIAGTPLLLLALLWLAGRAAIWFSAFLPPIVVAIADLAHLPVLAVMVLGGLMVRPAPRNLVFFVFLALLTVANVMIHAEWWDFTSDTASPALDAAVLLLALMVAIIGGRVVPAFTRNVLVMRGPSTALPRSFAWLDRVSLASLAILAGLAAAQIEGPPTALVAGVAAAGHLGRLSFWRGMATGGAPILWSLHLAYLFLGLGLAALALAHATGMLAVSAALHLLAIGAIGGMTLAMMTRAALGHTGRPLRVVRPIAGAYALVALAALVRALGVDLLPGHYMAVIYVAGILWVAGFGIFSAVYAPILVGPPLPKNPPSA